MCWRAIHPPSQADAEQLASLEKEIQAEHEVRVVGREIPAPPPSI